MNTLKELMNLKFQILIDSGKQLLKEWALNHLEMHYLITILMGSLMVDEEIMYHLM